METYGPRITDLLISFPTLAKTPAIRIPLGLCKQVEALMTIYTAQRFNADPRWAAPGKKREQAQTRHRELTEGLEWLAMVREFCLQEIEKSIDLPFEHGLEE